MVHRNKHLLNRAQRGGFTIAEAALAVGITAMVVITVLGLLPSGLDSMHQSALISADARLMQAVAADYQMREWSDLIKQQTSKSSEDFTFDYQGMAVAKGSTDTTFLARTQVLDAPLLPGSTSANARMKLVLIQVVSGSDVKLFQKPDRVRSYRTVVAQMGNTP